VTERAKAHKITVSRADTPAQVEGRTIEGEQHQAVEG
jgi:HSP20 family protein